MSNRPITTNLPQPATFPLGDGTEIQTRKYLAKGYKGINAQRPYYLNSPEYSIDSINVGVNVDGSVVTCGSFGAESTVFVDNIVAMYEHRTTTTSKLIVVTTVGIYRTTIQANSSIGTPVIATGVPVPPITLNDTISFLSWNEDKILITGHTFPHIILFDLVTNQLSYVDESPGGASHITMLSGRVVLSGFVDTTRRVQWSKKFNFEEWEPQDLGSGFEDLTQHTGGAGAVLGVYPFGDTTGLVVREYSIDYVSATDNFDAPFRFQQRYNNITTTSQRTIVKTPNSIILLTTKGVIDVGVSGEMRNLSDVVGFFGATKLGGQDYASCATYSESKDCYYISEFSFYVWVYNRKYGTWHREWTTNGRVNALCAINGLVYTQYDAMAGTYDAQPDVVTLDTISKNNLGIVLYSRDNRVGRSGVFLNNVFGFRVDVGCIAPVDVERSVSIVSVSLGISFIGFGSYDPNWNIQIQTSEDFSTWTNYGDPIAFVFNANHDKVYRRTVQQLVTGRQLYVRLITNPLMGTVGGLPLPPIMFDYFNVRYTDNEPEWNSP